MSVDLGLLTLLTVVASSVGTLTGFGMSTIMVPVLLFFFPLAQTLLIVGILHFCVNVWKIIFFKTGLNWSLILIFGVTGIVASWLGAMASFSVDEAIMLKILGAFLLAYVLMLLFKPKWRIKKRVSTQFFGGALSGFCAGIFGIGGAVRSAFLTAFHLPKDVYIFTGAVIALVIDLTRIFGYLHYETTLDPHIWQGFLLLIPASLLGSWIAKRIVDKIPEAMFRNVLAVFLGVMAIKLIAF